jgi:hypothetical protein
MATKLMANKPFAWLLPRSLHITDALSRLRRRRNYPDALHRAWSHLAARYPEAVASLFDEYFLSHAARDLLSVYVQPDASGGLRPTPHQLAAAWEAQMSFSAPQVLRRRRMADMLPVAADFLRWLEAELDRPPARVAGVTEAPPAQASGISEQHVNTLGNLVRLAGRLDATTYEEVIAQARALYARGERHLTLDLCGVTGIDLSGLFAIHCISLLFRGQTPPESEEGWRALRRAVEENLAAGMNLHVKVLNPSPHVEKVLRDNAVFCYLPIEHLPVST